MTHGNNPVDLIACAIATQENNPLTNPGNIRYAGQVGARCPRCGAAGGKVPGQCVSQGGAKFAVHDIADFVDRTHGIVALYRQIWAMVALGDSLTQIIATWAPPNENNTAAYLSNVRTWTALPVDVPVMSLLPKLVKLNGMDT